jgi:RimJ/RimL family protein N-acetyltransferase
MAIIQGELITLRTASTTDRPLIYQMGLSTDTIGHHFSKRTLAEFEASYHDRYFDNRDSTVCGGMMICVDDTPIGFISYGNTSGTVGGVEYPAVFGVMELDIWLYGEQNCGKGYGTDAVVTLAKYLHEMYGTHTVFMCPERNNPRAVRSYEKAGLTEVMGNEKQALLERIFMPEILASFDSNSEYLSIESLFMVKEFDTIK